MEAYILKVRKRISHMIRFVIIISIVFLIASTIFLDLFFALVLYDVVFSAPMIFFLAVVVIMTIGTIFIFPRYVIMDYGKLIIAYYFGVRKEYNYSEIQSFEIDDVIKIISLKIEGRKLYLDFFYSDDELEDIRKTFGKYRVKRRFGGGEDKKE